MASSRKTVLFIPLNIAGECNSGCSARGCERTEIKELRGISRIARLAHYIGAVKAFTATAEVTFEIVVEIERLTGLTRKCAVETPPVLQGCKLAAGIGKCIAEYPGHAVADIEIGISVFCARVR